MNAEASLSHAYIISAQPEEGYKKAAELAAAMVCSGSGKRPCGLCRDCRKAEKGIHPDIITVTRQKDDKGKLRREIYVDQIREIVDDSVIMPNEAVKKVYIVRDAGTMNQSAQNAFLKLLEEPPAFDAFILVADSASELLETVRSRCVLLTLNGGAEQPDKAASELAEKYLAHAAAKKPLALTVFLNSNNNISVQEAAEFARACAAMISDMLCRRSPDLGLTRAELMKLYELMAKAQEYLRFNVSVKHLFGLLAVRTIDLK